MALSLVREAPEAVTNRYNNACGLLYTKTCDPQNISYEPKQAYHPYMVQTFKKCTSFEE